MKANSVARDRLRRGYSEQCDGDFPSVAVTRPWQIRDRRTAHKLVRSLGQETREWLVAIFVDTNLNLLAVDAVGRCGISEADTDLGAILCRGHALKASGFILVHNHPSGTRTLSESEVRVTNRLRWQSDELDIPLLAYCIVAADNIVTIGWEGRPKDKSFEGPKISGSRPKS